jgi:drug/metabolite transporter (DMT)-like permease
VTVQAEQIEEAGADTAFAGGIVAVVAWGSGPLIVRAISASAATVVLYRIVLALPVMVLIAYMVGGKITWSVIRTAFVPGMLFFVTLATSFASFKETSIALATLIPAVQPALILFLAPRLFGEPSSRRQSGLAVVALLGVVGVVVAADSDGHAGMTGNLLALANLFFWTAYFVVVKRARAGGVHSWSFLACVMGVCSLFTIPYALIVSDDLGAIGGGDWGFMALMVLLPGVVGHGLMTWAARHLDVSIASLMTLASPIVSAVGAWIIYSESLTVLQVAFAAVVLGALGGVVLHARSDSTRETALSGPAE